MREPEVSLPSLHRSEGPWSRRLAALALVLGAAGMSGWWLESPTLVQVVPTFAPMQFNTALGILLCAVSALRFSAALSLCTALGALLLGGMSYLQDVGGWELGIDTLFVAPFTTVRSSHPGRMAPNTAMAMVLTATAQLALLVQRRRVLGSILGTMVCSLGGVAMLGYAFGFPFAYRWGHLTDMALHTSACWLLLGAATVHNALGGRSLWPGPAAREPLLAGLLCSCAFVGHSLALASLVGGQDTQLQAGLDVEARALAVRIEHELLEAAAILQQALAEQTEPLSDRELRERAPLLHEVARESADGPDVRLEALALSGGVSPELARFATSAESQPLAPRVELLRSESLLGLRVVPPDGTASRDRLLASIEGPVLMARARGDLMPGLFARLLLPGDARAAVAELSSSEHLLGDAWVRSTPTRWSDPAWTLELSPSESWLQTQRPRTPESLLLIGGATALLCALFSRKWVHVLRATRSAHTTAARLDREVREHLEARRELAESHRRLVEQKHRLDIALRAGEIGSWEWDLETNELQVDRRLERMLDAAPGSLSGAPAKWASLIQPASRPPLREAVAACRAGSPPESLDIRVITPQGQTRDLTVRGTLVRGDPAAPASIVGVCIDITRRLRVERELKRSNSHLEEFADAASHDLQEPLRRMSSLCEVVEARYHDKIDAEGWRFLGQAAEGAQQVQQLLSQLITLARVGRSDSARELVDTAEVVADTLRDVAERVQQCDAAITVGDLPVIYASPDGFARLMHNLIVNALVHCGPRPQVEIGSRTSGTDRLFWVRDHGPGIDPRDHSRIFRAFKRVAERASVGSGIGLALCRKIVEQHEGRIWVESELGEGATFFVALPILLSQHMEPSPTEPPPAPAG